MKIKWLDWVLILFGIFMIYQILRNLLGGSWGTDGLMLGLMIANVGLLWKLSLKFEGHILWHKFSDDVK